MKKRPGFKGWSRGFRGGPASAYVFSDSELRSGVEEEIVDWAEDIEGRVFSYSVIDHCLQWVETHQGYMYWRERANERTPMTEYDWEFLTQALRKMEETLGL